jgi:hypothetical protein
VNPEIETLCICGCSSREHTKLNRKAWDRLDKQLEGYKENSMKDREEFWEKYLTNGSQDEWACTGCNCRAFKQDNLKFLEDKLKEKKCR